MHFLDAWVELTLAEVLSLGGPVALALISLALPDLKWSARAAGLAPLALLLRPGVLADPYAWLWAAAGLGIAWGMRWAPASVAPRPQARGSVESAMLATALVGASAAVLIFAIAQQPFTPDDARDATQGVALTAVGLLHLALRRHLARAALAFLILGLGLAVLGRVARGALPAPHALGAPALLVGTLLAAAVALRSARNRAAAMGSVWVSAAHDLHD